MTARQPMLDFGHELVVDNFAGGGGASTGIEMALGRAIDIAINHDAEALAMHSANHPETLHLCESVFAVDPVAITKNQPVGLAWFSPDCTHHSKAKGGKPRSAKRRGLAWVAVRWAKRVRPRLIMLENVEEFEDWGPLTKDGNPCPDRKGQTFQQFVGQLERLGYKVEKRELRACDYGAPTIRKRLFIIARRDGLPIVWPKPTHGKWLIPYRTAAECIDWSIPCPSIFERKKPLVDATCRRIAAGIMRFVVNNPRPFVIGIDHQSAGTSPVWSSDLPLTTITCENRHALIVPTLVTLQGTEPSHIANSGRQLNAPLGTVIAQGTHHALVAAFIAKHYTGVVGMAADAPLGTITTVDHHSPVVVTLGKDHRPEVAAFLVKYYGNDHEAHSLNGPIHTIPTHDRFGLVTVRGEEYRIVDIGLRMLQPHELARGQGFPENYKLDPVINGKPLTKTAQVRMIGNSVCPDLAAALVRANFKHERKFMEKVA